MRDYKSKKTAEAAFEAGYDFYLEPETIPCSIRNFVPGTKVEIRYKQHREVTIYTVPDKEPENIAATMRHEKFMERFTKRPSPKSR